MTKLSEVSPVIAVIAGSGALPFAVADRLIAAGKRPVVLAVRGHCDPVAVTRYRHHWVALGQFGRLTRLLRQEQCRDVIFIGALVRPSLREIRLDLGTLTVIPSLVAAFRGGDDHLLTGVARLFEAQGFRLVGLTDLVPDLLAPAGVLTRSQPDAIATADIAKGMAMLQALSPFDVGQAAIVIDGNVVAVEDIEGTDGLLARVRRLRAEGRLRSKPGRGVLVKAPKIGQDLRFDLPTLGPRTVEGAKAAALGGIAITAGRTLIVEPQTVVTDADAARLFLTGLPA